MIRISLPYIFNLALNLEPLSNIAQGQKRGENIFTLWGAQNELDGLLNRSVFAPTLRTSNRLGRQLFDAIKEVTDNEDWEQPLEYIEAFKITNGYSQYKIALLAELEVLPSYFVTQKGGYDTQALLEGGEVLFPGALSAKVPEAVFDAKEAAKALAYELGTACGFHVFRALEAVLRRYYKEVTDGKAEPKVRNIGVYINAMKQAGKGEPKVLAVLKQIADFHRNPLIHPEVALDIDEAIGTLGVARSAIDLMLSELPEAPSTTLTGAS